MSTTATKYLTLDQISEQLHTPLDTVRFWIYSGKLAAFKPGRHPLVREEDLAAFIEGSALSKRRTAAARATRTARKPVQP